MVGDFLPHDNGTDYIPGPYTTGLVSVLHAFMTSYAPYDRHEPVLTGNRRARTLVGGFL